jgi:hypothetical protein
LTNLRKAQRNAWHFVLTGDQPWFFDYTPHRKLWMPPDVETAEVRRRLNKTPKVMVMIFWNVSGIRVIDYIRSGESFNSAGFIERILPTIAGLPSGTL